MKKYLILIIGLINIIIFSFTYGCENKCVVPKDKKQNKTKVIETDSIKLVSIIKNKKIEINDEVFGDCISFYLTKNNIDDLYTKTQIKDNFKSIFDDIFFDKIHRNKFDFFTQEENNKKYYCISISINTDEFEASRIYWFIKNEDRFYFTGMTCT